VTRSLSDIAEKLRGITPEAIDQMVERAALETLVELVKTTPKQWTGQTRKSWQVQKPAQGVRIVENDSKVMLFLEKGTKDHGPVNKKFLFIPLTRRAAAGWFKGLRYGVDYILKKWVKGIKPMNIVRDERPRARERLLNGMKGLVRQTLGITQ
jgi:hypothetical protein